MRHVGHLPRHYCPSFSFGRVENGGGARREVKVAANGEGGGGPSDSQKKNFKKAKQAGFFFGVRGFETFFLFLFLPTLSYVERERETSVQSPPCFVFILLS